MSSANAASLYYHFRDEASSSPPSPGRARRDAAPTAQDDHPWIEWFVEVTCAVRG
jgi:hypothetical protein